MLHVPKMPSVQVRETLRHYNLLASEDGRMMLNLASLGVLMPSTHGSAVSSTSGSTGVVLAAVNQLLVIDSVSSIGQQSQEKVSTK